MNYNPEKMGKEDFLTAGQAFRSLTKNFAIALVILVILAEGVYFLQNGTLLH